ncbi:MAG: hypothetical protein H6730_08480 [Deltaproteobacteria bacterium]|nr:hypothetical protein [Deltaproteobacteria bacterium]
MRPASTLVTSVSMVISLTGAFTAGMRISPMAMAISISITSLICCF